MAYDKIQFFLVDGQYQRIFMVEKYSSLIWTERFASWADFEMKIPMKELHPQFRPGVRVMIDDSNIVCTAETFDWSINDSGEVQVVIAGRSIDGTILSNRTYHGLNSMFSNRGDYTRHEYSTYKATPHNMAAWVVLTAIGDTKDGYAQGIPVEDRFPQLKADVPVSVVNNHLRIPWNEDSYEFSPYRYARTYDILSDIATAFNFGWSFALTKRGGNEFVFRVFKGFDRTDPKNRVIGFDLESGDISSIKYTNSIVDHKNVAYVYGKYGNTMVGNTLSIGLGRRVMYVDASSIETPHGPELMKQLELEGLLALAKQRQIRLISGEFSESRHVYEKDYALGDVVWVRTPFGDFKQLVSEFIRINDEEGYREYPGLTQY